jgi:hypothetical protein
MRAGLAAIERDPVDSPRLLRLWADGHPSLLRREGKKHAAYEKPCRDEYSGMTGEVIVC